MYPSCMTSLNSCSVRAAGGLGPVYSLKDSQEPLPVDIPSTWQGWALPLLLFSSLYWTALDKDRHCLLSYSQTLVPCGGPWLCHKLSPVCYDSY